MTNTIKSLLIGGVLIGLWVGLSQISPPKSMNSGGCATNSSASSGGG